MSKREYNNGFDDGVIATALAGLAVIFLPGFLEYLWDSYWDKVDDKVRKAVDDANRGPIREEIKSQLYKEWRIGK